MNGVLCWHTKSSQGMTRTYIISRSAKNKQRNGQTKTWSFIYLTYLTIIGCLVKEVDLSFDGWLALAGADQETVDRVLNNYYYTWINIQWQWWKSLIIYPSLRMLKKACLTWASLLLMASVFWVRVLGRTSFKQRVRKVRHKVNRADLINSLPASQSVVLTGFLTTAGVMSFSKDFPGNVKLGLDVSRAVTLELDAGLLPRLVDDITKVDEVAA